MGDGYDESDLNGSGPRLVEADITFDKNADLADKAVNVIDPEDHEVSFSAEFSLDLEQTVICNHCGSLNGVPEADFITFFKVDPSCLRCGYPLGVIR